MVLGTPHPVLCRYLKKRWCGGGGVDIFSAPVVKFSEPGKSVWSLGHVKWPHLSKSLNGRHSYNDWPVALKLSAIDIVLSLSAVATHSLSQDSTLYWLHGGPGAGQSEGNCRDVTRAYTRREPIVRPWPVSNCLTALGRATAAPERRRPQLRVGAVAKRCHDTTDVSDSINKMYISEFWYLWPMVRSILRPLHYKSMGINWKAPLMDRSHFKPTLKYMVTGRLDTLNQKIVPSDPSSCPRGHFKSWKVANSFSAITFDRDKLERIAMKDESTIDVLRQTISALEMEKLDAQLHPVPIGMDIKD